MTPKGDISMDARKLLGNVPWITKDGNLDLAKFPIDGTLKQALSGDVDEFRSGVNMLRTMHGYGRDEAGIFLLGLLVACNENLERRGLIVEALRGVNTKACADLLFGELRRVRSSNTTRRYLAAVIKVLASMPSELIQEGFTLLANDKSFSQRMRDKFKEVIGEGRHFEEDWF
jgi:hypothetical protein